MNIITSGSKKYIVFGVVALALFMSSIDTTVVATALPAIEHGLKAPLSWTGWVITAYSLMILTMMPLMGRISDEWGRKRVFIASVVIFTVSSFCCAMSPNIYLLIIFRFIQALGGGSFLPSATGIVSEHFPESRSKAIGLFTTIFPLGGIVGPAIGGWILDVSGWQAIFLVNVPVGILVLILACLLLEPDPPLRRTPVDLAGAGLFSGAILSLMYLMTRLGGKSNARWLDILLLLAAGCLMAAFIRHEQVSQAPIIEMSLLKSRTFAVINLLNLFYGAVIFGLMAFIPYFAQVAYGMSNLASGTLLTARALGMIAMGGITSMLLERTGYRKPMAWGFGVLAASTLALNPYFHLPAIFGWRITDFWWLAALIFISGIAVGMASPSSNNAAIELMPEKISAITGLRGMFRQSGGVLGTSVIILILARFSNKAAGFRVVFLGMTVMLLLSLPLIRYVPDGRISGTADHRRGYVPHP
jgi:EmrB/QacA subfamily drug resistance transporter